MSNKVAVVHCFIYHQAGSYMRRGDVGEVSNACYEITFGVALWCFTPEWKGRFVIASSQ